MDVFRTWLKGEWPLLVGIALSWFLVGQHAFQYLGIPDGSDWGVYLRGAEHVWHPERDTTFPDWRTPTYAWLVGLLGESMGYVRAGQVLSSLSALLTVLAAGLLGRALANPWVGGLAALAAAGFTPLAHGAHWVNHYPLLGATTGLSLALAALASRRPHAVLGLAAGLAAGASLALDLRGMAAIPAGAILCGLGLFVRTSPWKHRAGTLAFFLAAVLSVNLGEGRLTERVGTRLMPLDKQVLHQRELTLDWQTWGSNPLAREVQEACADTRAGPLEIGDLFNTCGTTMLSTNLRRLWNARSLPPATSLLLLALACLPAAWGRRSIFASGVLAGVSLVSITLGAAWVTYWDRYVLQFAAPLCALVPVGLARISHWAGVLTRREGVGTWVGISTAGAWILLVWPGVVQGVPGTPPLREKVPAQVAIWAAENVSEDDLLVDCAGLGINQFLLPDRIPLSDFVNQPRACLDSLKRPGPAGRRFVVARHLPSNHGGVEKGINAAELEQLGWQVVQEHHAPPARIAIWSR